MEPAPVVYFLLTHGLPEMTHRLTARLLDESPTGHVVVHHDFSQSPLPPLELSRAHVVPDPVATSRGNMTQVQATLRGLDWIRAHLDYRWVILLSAQDYPIVPVERIERALLDAPLDAFVRIQRGDAAERHIRERYFRRWYTVPVPFRKRKKWTLTRPYNRIFRDGYRCYKGSTWWMLSRPAIDWLYDFLARSPDYWRQYAKAFMPDESFFVTALLNGPLRVHCNNMRYVDWNVAGARHPRLLTTADLPAIIASPHWFARKFNARTDAHVLDLLDAHRRTWRGELTYVPIDAPAGPASSIAGGV